MIREVLASVVYAPQIKSKSSLTLISATDSNIIISPSGTGILSILTNVDLNGQTLTNMADPLNPMDAVTKQYADAISAGLDPKASVRAATTAPLASGSYSAGSFTSWTPVAIDGVTLGADDRLLIKNQADAKQNGIYTFDGGTTLSRSSDMDGTPSNEVSGGNFTFVEAGTANAGKGYVLVFDGNVTLDTDDVNFTQFSATSGATTFLDSTFAIQDDGDNTKQIAFQASGITTGTTRTITMGDADVNLSLTTSGSFATSTLNNLGTTAINAALLPATSNTISLGANFNKWANVYVGTSILGSNTQLNVGSTDSNNIFGVAISGLSDVNNDVGIWTSLNAAANGTATHSIYIATGSKNAGTGNSGSLKTGTGNSTGGNSGDYSILIGTAGGTQGNIKFLKSGVASVVGQVWTATGTDGSGYWATPSSGTVFADNVFAIQDDGDATKQLMFEVSTITTGTTRTITMPDSDLNLDAATPGTGTFANATLSNLGSTAINTSLISDTDATDDLGSSSIRWRNAFIQFAATSSGGTSVNFQDRQLTDSNSDTIAADWDVRRLFANDGTTINLEWSSAGVVSVNSALISNVQDPVSDQDAATKIYVDGKVAVAPVWVKYTVDFTAFATAANTNTIELFSLPAGSVLHGVVVKHSVAFSGGSISAYTVSVGITGMLDKFSTAFDVFEAVGSSTAQASEDLTPVDFVSASSIKVTAISTGDTLDNATAGSVDIWVSVAQLPL